MTNPLHNGVVSILMLCSIQYLPYRDKWIVIYVNQSLVSQYIELIRN